jgi:hypothetical protein
VPTNLSVGRVLRVVVFMLLLVSASLGIFLSEKLWSLWGDGSLPLWAPLGPPAAFFAFMVVFALDRAHAAHARAVSPARAMFQVGATVVFLMLLLPHQGMSFKALKRAREARRRAEGQSLVAPARLLFEHDDEGVRAAACVLLGTHVRSLGRAHKEPLLTAMLAEVAREDPSVGVRRACTQALGGLQLAAPGMPMLPPGHPSLLPGALGDGGADDDEDDDDEGDGEDGPREGGEPGAESRRGPCMPDGACPSDEDDDVDDGAIAL